jgi:hypothetical protein
MANGVAFHTVRQMRGTFAVLWTLNSSVHTGSLELRADRLELRTRGRTVAVPLCSIQRAVIERGPTARINGLPVLELRLPGEVVVHVASLQGVGLLHQVARLLSPAAANGT